MIKALVLILGMIVALPAFAQCPVTQTTPGFTAGGNVFGRIKDQWNSYFGAKADANDGTLCNPTIIGGIGIGNVQSIPTTITNDLAIWSGTGATLGDSGGIFSAGPTGLSIGYGNPPDASGKLAIRNTYTGNSPPAGSTYGVYSLMDYKPTADVLNNPNGIYGTLWYNSAHTFTGWGAAIRGNVYTIPQLTAAIAVTGSSYVTGEVVTIVGGTCTTFYNTEPQFTVTAVNGIPTAATYIEGNGACTVYPVNPVATTSSGSGSGLTLNLTNSAINVENLIGIYGRARHTSSGTIINSYGLFSDGGFNTGGGTVTNKVGVGIMAPGDTNHTNAYGIYLKSGTCSPTCYSASIYADGDAINLKTGGANDIVFDPGGVTRFNSMAVTKGYIIGSFPIGVAGARAHTINQITACPAFGATFTAGGVLVCPAFYNGSQWVSG